MDPKIIRNKETLNGKSKNNISFENLFLQIIRTLLDIEKVYDIVNRRMPCKVLERIGMSEKIVRIISNMYENTRVKFSMGDLDTGWVSSK